MKDAWAAFVQAEIPRIRGLISTFRHEALPNGRVPREDRDVVVSDAFVRLRDGLKLEGATIGEARACVRHAATWAFQDYVRAYVREDRRRGGSIDRHPDADERGGGRGRPPVEPATGPDVVHDEATRARIGDLVLRIDENKREVVVLSVAGHSADEIAARLSLTRANVYQLRKRGLDQLRSALEDES